MFVFRLMSCQSPKGWKTKAREKRAAMYKILLIDDEESVHIALKEFLVSNGYEFRGAFTGWGGFEMIKEERPDLVLLDVMLPDINGFELCNEIRESGRHVPIIFVSAKGDIVDKSIGYRAGADDYVTKPFNPTELLLRIAAVIKRHKDVLVIVKDQQREDVIVIGDLEVRFAEHDAYVRGKPSHLTSKEFDILAALAANPGTVFSREQIYESVWGEEAYKAQNSITVFVRKIREKIEDNPSEPQYLLTVQRIGYKVPEAQGLG